MKRWLALSEIAALRLDGLPATARGLHSLAEREGWRNDPHFARARQGRGGGWEFAFERLPMRAQLDYAARHVDAERHRGAAAELAPQGDMAVAGGAERDARLAVIAVADGLARSADLPRRAADPLFARLYNDGEVAVSPWVRDLVGSVSPRSLARWRGAYKRDANDLAFDRSASRKGTSVLDRAEGGEVRAHVLALIGRRPQAHVLDTANPHGVTKAQVGLGNVDNTSDADKPVSTAQQAAFDKRMQVRQSAATLPTGQALTVANCGRFFTAEYGAAGWTVTLPDTATLEDGWHVTFEGTGLAQWGTDGSNATIVTHDLLKNIDYRGHASPTFHMLGRGEVFTVYWLAAEDRFVAECRAQPSEVQAERGITGGAAWQSSPTAWTLLSFNSDYADHVAFAKVAGGFRAPVSARFVANAQAHYTALSAGGVSANAWVSPGLGQGGGVAPTKGANWRRYVNTQDTGVETCRWTVDARPGDYIICYMITGHAGVWEWVNDRFLNVEMIGR